MTVTRFKYGDGSPDQTSNHATITSASYTNASNLTEVIFGTDCIHIGDNAFFMLDSLTSVIFVEGLQSIGNSAFQGSKNIGPLAFPASLVSIGQVAFNPFSNVDNNITEITFATGSQLTTIGQYAFAGVRATTITVPASVTSLADGVFSYSVTLTTVVWEDQGALSSASSNVFVGSEAITDVWYETGPPLSSAAAGITYPAGATIHFGSPPTPPPPCFSDGTKILCWEKGQKVWKNVEQMKEGDVVESYLHGGRKIARKIRGEFMNCPKKPYRCMFRMKRTETNGLTEDLMVTGNHGVMVEHEVLEALSPEKRSLNKRTLGGKEHMLDGKWYLIASCHPDFEAVLENKRFAYHHFALEGEVDENQRFGVFANGLLMETPSANDLQQRDKLLTLDHTMQKLWEPLAQELRSSCPKKIRL